MPNQKFARPRGTRDVLPEEMEARRWLEGAFRSAFEGYGYREVQTPTFEHLELVIAKSGEEIKKHLYDFTDKGGRELVLRPELTAPVMRLYLQELTHASKPLRLYYLGNCFRYEEPQSGRYREFWQAGVELIGSPFAEAETEVIAVAAAALERTGLPAYELLIGEVGILRSILREGGAGEEDQARVMNALDKGEDVRPLMTEMGIPEECQRTLVGISRLEGGREVIAEAKEFLAGNDEALSKAAGQEELLDLLDSQGVKYGIDLGIARGLEYYTGMVFEIYAEGLGAQKQICGGGTYSLTEVFGGAATPTCGFAFGMDRLLLAMEKQGRTPPSKKKRILVVPAGSETLKKALEISAAIRKSIPCETELLRRKLKKALAYADREGIPFVVIVGEDELRKGCVVLRDMHSGEQRELRVEELDKLGLQLG